MSFKPIILKCSNSQNNFYYSRKAELHLMYLNIWLLLTYIKTFTNILILTYI